METLFSFLINASAGIVLFYIVYWIFLRKETFYTANRWFLLTALLTAVVVPVFPIQYTVFVEAENSKTAIKTISDTFKSIPAVGGSEFENSGFSWQHAIFLVYITGVAIFLLRLISQTLILVHLMIKYQIKSFNGVRIVENEKYGLPFSFFNVIFINPKFHTQDDLPEILAHEKVHIRENHWFDLLFIELLTVIFWFNPFIWFFERSIKQNHEYLADEGVLAQGHALGRYQALLINQLMGMQIIGITNNLNFALNKTRLKMMTKKKTSAIGRIKFLWALPAIALLLFAFAEPSYRAKNVEPRGSELMIEKNQKTIKIAGLVLDENEKPLPGTSVVIKGSTVGTVSDTDGRFKLEIPEASSIVLSYIGKTTIEENFSALAAGTKKDEVFQKKYQMKDNVIVLDTDIPPPPPKAKDKSDIPPPPPPPSKPDKGEKEVFYIVEDMPQYPGGYFELIAYVKQMQKKIAVQKKVSGKATVSFTVDKKGKVTDIKIVEKDNDSAAKGAFIIASEMKDWNPGKQRGKAVSVKYLLPVEFK